MNAPSVSKQIQLADWVKDLGQNHGSDLHLQTGEVAIGQGQDRLLGIIFLGGSEMGPLDGNHVNRACRVARQAGRAKLNALGREEEAEALRWRHGRPYLQS